MPFFPCLLGYASSERRIEEKWPGPASSEPDGLLQADLFDGVLQGPSHVGDDVGAAGPGTQPVEAVASVLFEARDGQGKRWSIRLTTTERKEILIQKYSKVY